MNEKKYALWYVNMYRCLQYIDFIGTAEECLRELDYRAPLRWVMRTYEE